MNKILNETMRRYLESMKKYLKITTNLQEYCINGYELGEITKEEVVDFYTELYKVCTTEEVREVGNRFNEIFGEEITNAVMESMNVEVEEG